METSVRRISSPAQALDIPLDFDDPAVSAAFGAFPRAEREGLLVLRTQIYRIAAETEGVGALLETLKWGQPAYLTPETKSGSTIRLGCPKSGGYALFVHCQTTILSDFRDLFPGAFRYDGNRAVLFDPETRPAAEPLSILIRSALTYHQKRR